MGRADAMRNQLKTGDADVRSTEAAQVASHLIDGAAKKSENPRQHERVRSVCSYDFQCVTCPLMSMLSMVHARVQLQS